MGSKLLLGIFLFLFVFSFLIAEITNTTYSLISPITLSVVSVLLSVVIGASNTPIAKGGAMLAFFAALTGYFLFSPVPSLIFGVIIVPIFLAMGMAMAEVGQG